MKICILGDPSTVHVQRIAIGLALRGLDVTVLCHKPVDIPGVTVERFEVPGFGWQYPRRWAGRATSYMRNLMRRFDVVHVHFLHDWGLTPEIIDEGCFVATPWGSDIVPPPGEAPPTSSVIKARRMMLRNAALVTAWGPTFAETVAEYGGISEWDIDLLPLGVDLELFRPAEANKSTDPQALKIGFFKGFREVYGPTFLLRAIPTVLEEFPTARFHLIGDGPQLMACKELAGFFDVDFSIKWIKRQSHENIPNHLAGWDLSVIPSVCESFGAAALESAAMRVPVVASDVGGLHDAVIHEETGLLIPAKAPEQLADAMIRLLADPPLRKQMGEAGRTLVRCHYDWQKILDRWVVTYEKAVDSVAALV